MNDGASLSPEEAPEGTDMDITPTPENDQVLLVEVVNPSVIDPEDLIIVFVSSLDDFLVSLDC